ncbi:HD-GYP domain-containing protein [Desulfitobacterium sp.]|uniref:HD-GYP domain-containing protein n=1 Tax=Desulfitobacterium sp. TaxID=49981 RepID=UPI002C1C0236|nr:HD domain-containing phosphohydrolase [Desulfitobacterium sp.]HVJ50647.1 HD domain-containing phosphohydrolase [Desulfitobacterium sp.]
MLNLPRKFKKTSFITILLALFVISYSLLQIQLDLRLALSLFVFCILAICSESLPVALPKGGFVTVTYAILIAAVILFPISISLLIAAVGPLLLLGKDPLWKRIFNSAQFVLSMFIAKEVILLAGVSGFQFNFKAISYDILGAISFMLTNMTIVSIALAQLNKKSPWAYWVGNIRWSVPNFLALAPLGIIMAAIYTNYGTIGIILLFVPLLIARQSFQLYIQMRKNYLNTVEALVQALEAKDSYTSGHSSRVAEFSVKLAEELKLSEERVEFIKYAGVLHDVGKIGVSETVLNKQGPLTESEWEMIRNHPSIGQNIIQSIDFLFDVSQVVRHHHERIDGKGYPDGLIGEDIPLESRIIAVADSYDAMTSVRSYRQGKSTSAALIELESVAGTQLDAQLVDIFCKIVRRDIEQGFKEVDNAH